MKAREFAETYRGGELANFAQPYSVWLEFAEDYAAERVKELESLVAVASEMGRTLGARVKSAEVTAEELKDQIDFLTREIGNFQRNSDHSASLLQVAEARLEKLKQALMEIGKVADKLHAKNRNGTQRAGLDLIRNIAQRQWWRAALSAVTPEEPRKS